PQERWLGPHRVYADFAVAPGLRHTQTVRDPGAPVDLYRLLEAAGEPELIDREIPENAEILELGCGSGRITHPLIALGRRIVAVDFNQEMLELLEGAETVLWSIEETVLARTPCRCVLT